MPWVNYMCHFCVIWKWQSFRLQSGAAIDCQPDAMLATSQEDGKSLLGCKHWDPAGLAWHGKRPKAGNGKKMESKWKTAPSWTGPKMAKKWPKNRFLRRFPLFFHFWAIFYHFWTRPAWGRFHSDFHFFSISGFWPFSMPYQPGRIPMQARKEHPHKDSKGPPV